MAGQRGWGGLPNEHRGWPERSIHIFADILWFSLFITWALQLAHFESLVGARSSVTPWRYRKVWDGLVLERLMGETNMLEDGITIE